MVILGIDPGSRSAGFGLVRQDGKKIILLASGVMRYDFAGNFVDRLAEIYNSCNELRDKYIPDEIAIESLIYVKSVSSLAKLAQARGAMIAAFSKTHKNKIFEYSPNLIKAAISGDGHASKESIQKGLQMIFGKRDFKTSDESDAIAIATCHAFCRRNILRTQERIL
ncbi:MAG: crossover junction endodeoxyribonuclease RuvC [Bdellovibrionales bacterium RIFOXYD12_FULL_39_22]|nr:MAG: crossover junction endodeoxyribonuclease RuvC [Bdellovibrionales bacterium RIFOXYB1_FULL_39_21]OFZ41938.1 MAG: crossover junction endodeoxyribonuclease RuvC [Bdellovibrionales bacterium RIFOXYC12_FULL_39_17]OFZ50654.1 MAG: crossover junction endodeoxyribonuclease RuvC [Bdellovibrionales bacterium RIFOXYC1_FULL_39_130]OFZ77877.1 MAG: crossover junction endodeoxyribonuclease RuvC [Bdellovibrionales bacterium RIFOXYD1_FULL_39_84]OFZ93687.1 MAG: crossover junction endodeoxyribonuclease RuvC